MKILFLTNFYPPYKLGGQEHSCQDVVAGLKQRGHEITVLTSMQGTNNRPVIENGIHRLLYLEMDSVPWLHGLNFFIQRKKREKHNLHALEQVMAQFKPDVVFIWGMWNLPRSLPALAEATYPGKILYRFASYWPTLPSQNELYWRTPGRTWLSRLLKGPLSFLAQALMSRDGPLPSLKFEHAICVSAATRDILVEAGIPVSHARVIYTGLDNRRYLDSNRFHQPQNIKEQGLNLLYAGRLTADKGIETAIKAMAGLVSVQNFDAIKLNVAGSGSNDYENHLRLLVDQERLTDKISFLGYVPRQQMPALFQKYDVLLVPSVWPEPFARVVLEGMISGLVVVAAQSGGTGEIIVDGENGLLFPPGNAEELAQKIACLATDPELRQQIAGKGQKMVTEKFTFTTMMDEFEAYLQEIASL